jgi:hypothetical protein
VGASLVERRRRDQDADKNDLLAEGSLDQAQRTSTSITQVATRWLGPDNTTVPSSRNSTSPSPPG